MDADTRDSFWKLQLFWMTKALVLPSRSRAKEQPSVPSSVWPVANLLFFMKGGRLNKYLEAPL